MKAVGDVLNTFKTASRGFLNSSLNSFLGSHGQWDRWVKCLCRGSDPAGEVTGVVLCVVPQCYNLLRF